MLRVSPSPAAAAAAANQLAGAGVTPAPVRVAAPRGVGSPSAAAACRAAGKGRSVEYNASYAYHSLFAYFDRDNVALKGFAKFFKESSDEEREHAEKLMEYQNKRGGRVRLQSIVTPLTEFDHPEKGDALYSMELALALEKLVNEKLHNLHGVATRCNDPQLTDFIESEFLEEQGCGTLIRCCLRKRPKGRTDCGCSRTKGLKEGKKCEMIRLGNNGRHGPAEEALGNKRGGKVRIQTSKSIATPLTEFDHPEEGDALYAE
ncbi:unnamed protein product [Miscanthus lutarioriparius]|uniref:Ferritin n=1 Tax=Miscanthus lutarioriparius TaxID=422564 RepID=A0A811RGP7_9POAL|nr:unnamed protein product [Miscanthus lutarioriparius]